MWTLWTDVWSCTRTQSDISWGQNICCGVFILHYEATKAGSGKPTKLQSTLPALVAIEMNP